MFGFFQVPKIVNEGLELSVSQSWTLLCIYGNVFNYFVLFLYTKCCWEASALGLSSGGFLNE